MISPRICSLFHLKEVESGSPASSNVNNELILHFTLLKTSPLVHTFKILSQKLVYTTGKKGIFLSFVNQNFRFLSSLNNLKF